MKNTNRVSACGLLFCFNEMEVIGETIKYYLSRGIDLVICDNQSTDSSMAIVKGFVSEGNRYGGTIRDIVTIATKGYEWQYILRQASDYMHKNLNNYDWILLIDADTHYASPVRGMPLPEYLREADKLGYNILQGRLIAFYPTEKDDPSIADYSRRIKYCQSDIVYPQEKIFRYHPTVDFYSYYGHACLRDDRRVCINPGFIIKHYIWISYEQGARKVFKDRKPRYVGFFSQQYSNMLPIKSDFIKNSLTLRYYDEKKELITRLRFFWVSKFILAYGRIYSFTRDLIRNPSAHEIRSSDPDRAVIGEKRAISSVLNAMVGAIVPAWGRRFIKRVRKMAIPYPVDPSPAYYCCAYSDGACFNFIDRWVTPPLGDAKAGAGWLCSYPSVYHFLMINRCNARCVFCNQIDNIPVKEITLDEFKVMISHIEMDSAREFYFSGGGEPLLCKDLFDIIRFVNVNYPKIKVKIITNGLLIEKYAEDIAGLDIEELIISVHGTEDMNDYILQTKDSGSIFRGIRLLNRHLVHLHKKIDAYFSMAVSSININEIPALIKKAADLNVKRVLVFFCRYYSHRIGGRLKIEDSLFFHKELYNRTVKKAARLAKTMGVSFYHEPLFSKKIDKKRCCAPWCMTIVDWDGDVYPCTGGEVRFFDKVKSGEYHFGNLLKESVREFWLNDSYIKLRRHLLASYQETNFPECDKCHNIACFDGPDVIHGHIIPRLAGMPDKK